MFHDYDDIVSIDQMKEMLFIGKNAAYTLLRSGEIQHLKIGKAYRIPKSEIIHYIIKKCKESG